MTWRMNEHRESLDALELPQFSLSERSTIEWELNFERYRLDWEHKWIKIPINKEWSLEIIQDSKYNSFRDTKRKSPADLCDTLLRFWKVWLHSWNDDDYFSIGFRLVTKDPAFENPYDVIQQRFKEAETGARASIDSELAEVQAEIQRLEALKEELMKDRKRLQELIWNIPRQLLGGVQLDAIKKWLEEFEQKES